MGRTSDLALRIQAGWVLVFGLAMGASCAPSKAQSRRIIRPPETIAHVRVHRALQYADQRILEEPWHRLRVRHNPSYCDSPAWEAHMYGAWRRVDLQPVPSKADAQMEEAWLRPKGTAFENEQEWKYPTFEWRASDATR